MIQILAILDDERLIHAGECRFQTRGIGIINISSTYGQKGAAFASIYVGAKHAGKGITNSMALEVAKSEIRVNAVMPGRTDTWHAAPLPRRWRNYRSWWRRFRWGGNACPKGTNA